MNTTTTLAIGLLLILGVGGIVYWQVADEAWTSEPANTESVITQSESEDQELEDQEELQEGVQGALVGTGITMAVIAQHNSRTSCWSVINGSVYDLTSWIPKHPGGEQAIVQLCGIDGSTKFNGQHGGQAKQATVLAGFKIGTLSQ